MIYIDLQGFSTIQKVVGLGISGPINGFLGEISRNYHRFALEMMIPQQTWDFF